MIMSLEQRKIKIKPKKKNEPQHIYQKRMSVLMKEKMEFVSPNILRVA